MKSYFDWPMGGSQLNYYYYYYYYYYYLLNYY